MRGKRYIAVELDPPERNAVAKDGSAGAGSFLVEGARELARAGADAITIADNPAGRVRADSAVMACKVAREAGVLAIPHLTCRDRSREAIKSTLLALDAEGLHTVLAVTGDRDRPPRTPESTGPGRAPSRFASGWSSERLAGAIGAWGTDSFSRPFRVWGALNVNARNFRAELERARRKAAAGVCAFLTQPAFTDAAFGNLALARAELGYPILGGVLPVVSERNADFLARGEIPGISVDESVARRFAGASREEAADISVGYALSLARRMETYVDGWYVITPFARVDIVARLVRALAAESRTPESGTRPAARGSPRLTHDFQRLPHEPEDALVEVDVLRP